LTTNNSRLEKMKQAEKAAEELVKARAGGGDTSKTDEAPAPNGDTPTDQNVDQGDIQQDAGSVQDQGVSDPAPDDGDTWRRRYEALKGKYDAEVPRMAAQFRELRDALTERDSVISQLRSEIDALKAYGTKAPESPASGISDEQRQRLTDLYGPDFMDAVQAVAREVLAHQSKPIVQQVEELKRETALTKEQRFWSDLTAGIPDWRTINEDPRFHDWLAQVDPVSGRDRQTYLAEAQKALDSARVINIFQAFKQTLQQQKPPTPPQPPRRPIAPGRGGSQDTTPATPQYTVEDWVALQDEIRRGKWKGREAEAQRLEAEIHAALFGNKPQ